MKSYLMMLYVTFEQESALKKFFHVQGWSFCKPDLSVTTDKLGPTIYRTSVKEQPELLKPLYKEKRTLKPGNIQESPPAKLLKTAEGSSSTQNKQSEIKETCSAEESGAEEQLPVTFANATNSYEPIKTQSSTSIVLPDGNEVTVKMEADESDGNGADDTLGNSDNNEDDDTDVDYSFEGLEEGELRLKTEDVSDAGGDQIGDNSTLDNSAEDQSQEKAQTSGKQKPDGAKGKSKQQDQQGHKTSEKSDYYSHVCEFCFQVYKTKGILNRHRKQHLNNFVCKKCRKPFADEESLRRHKIEGHPLKYTCEVCGKSFETKQQLQEHSEIHIEVRSFPCTFPGCTKQFSRKDYLSEHTNYHTGDWPYLCSKCGKKFKTRRVHNKHVNNCGDFVLCKICKKLMTPQSLPGHMDFYHGKDVNFFCQWCGMGYKYRSGLSKHKTKCEALKKEVMYDVKRKDRNQEEDGNSDDNMNVSFRSVYLK